MAQSVFQVLEEPVEKNPDWYTRKLKHHIPMGEDEYIWIVELMHRPTGATVEMRNASLHVAFVRAVEAARWSDIERQSAERADGGQSLS